MENSSLGEIAEIVMGQSPLGETCNSEGRGLPLLNGPTEFGSHHPTPVQFTTDPRKRAFPGDILFCVRGSTTGRMNWADREYAIGRGVAAIRHKGDAGLQPFVRAVIEFGLKDLLAQATGSTFPNVSASQLASLPTPSLEDGEKRAIAHILGTLDDKIELNRRMNATLEALARALFKSWFVDFDPVRAKAESRPPAGLDAATAALFPDGFEDSPLGEVPRGWRVGKLSDICVTQYGYTASATEEPVGPHFLRVTDINKQNWIEWESVPYCRIPKDQQGKYALKEGDIVVARMADPGKSAIIDEPVDAVFASYLVRLKTQSLVQARYIHGFLKSSAYGDYASGAMSGSVQANMNARVIVGADLIIPPQHILERFAQLILPVRRKIAANVRGSHTLATLRDALLPRLLSGEVRVG